MFMNEYIMYIYIYIYTYISIIFITNRHYMYVYLPRVLAVVLLVRPFWQRDALPR